MHAVVLAGGWGRRLGPLTARRPKPLIPVAGRRIIDYTLQDLARVRPSEATVIVDPRVLPLEGLPGWARAVGQEAPGLASALRQAARILSEARGDLALISFTGYLARPWGLARSVLDYYSSTSHPAVIAVAPVSTGLETFGFVELGPRHQVARVSKELEEWRAGRGYVFAGILVAEKSVAEELGGAGGFMEALNRLAARKLLGAYVWQGDWLEIAYPWDLLEAPRIVLEGSSTMLHPRARVAPTARIGPGVVVEEGARIGEGAVIHGPAYIGRGAAVGEYSVVGPGTLLEEGVTVEEHAVVRESVLLESARVEAGRLSRTVLGEGAVVEACSYIVSSPRSEPAEWMEKLVEARAHRLRVRLGAVAAPSARIRQCSRIGPQALVG